MNRNLYSNSEINAVFSAGCLVNHIDISCGSVVMVCSTKLLLSSQLISVLFKIFVRTLVQNLPLVKPSIFKVRAEAIYFLKMNSTVIDHAGKGDGTTLDDKFRVTTVTAVSGKVMLGISFSKNTLCTFSEIKSLFLFLQCHSRAPINNCICLYLISSSFIFHAGVYLTFIQERDTFFVNPSYNEECSKKQHMGVICG